MIIKAKKVQQVRDDIICTLYEIAKIIGQPAEMKLYGTVCSMTQWMFLLTCTDTLLLEALQHGDDLDEVTLSEEFDKVFELIADVKFASDKKKAIKGQMRTKEKDLLLLQYQ